MPLFMVKHIEIFDGEHPKAEVVGFYDEEDPAINVMNSTWNRQEYDLGNPTITRSKIHIDRDGDYAAVEIVYFENVGVVNRHDMFEGTGY